MPNFEVRRWFEMASLEIWQTAAMLMLTGKKKKKQLLGRLVQIFTASAYYCHQQMQRCSVSLLGEIARHAKWAICVRCVYWTTPIEDSGIYGSLWFKAKGSCRWITITMQSKITAGQLPPSKCQQTDGYIQLSCFFLLLRLSQKPCMSNLRCNKERIMQAWKCFYYTIMIYLFHDNLSINSFGMFHPGHEGLNEPTNKASQP